MIIGLITVLMLLFGGGFETVLLDPQFKKHAHAEVHEKANVKAIDAELTAVEKRQKAFVKGSLKPAVKSFQTLNMDFGSSREQFDVVKQDFHSKLSALQDAHITSELAIKGHTTADEWARMMAAVLEKPEKEKQRTKLDQFCDGLRDELTKACDKAIPDIAAQASAHLLASEYRDRVHALSEQLMDRSYRSHAVIQRHDAPRSDYETIGKEIMQLRRDHLEHLLDMRFQLKAMTTPANWQLIAKAINKNMDKTASMH